MKINDWIDGKCNIYLWPVITTRTHCDVCNNKKYNENELQNLSEINKILLFTV